MTLLGVGGPVAGGSPPTSTTWNPSAAGTGAGLVFSNGNLTATQSGANGFNPMKTVTGHSTGLYYAEYTGILIQTATGGIIGLADSGSLPADIGTTVGTLGFHDSATTWRSNNSLYASAVFMWVSGNRLGFAVNLTAKLMWLRINGGNWNNDILANQNPVGNVGGIDLTSYMAGATAPFYLAFTLYQTGDTVTANFSATGTVDTPPTGYGAW